MAKTDFKSVHDYIASQPQPVQPVLKRVRSAIRKAMPMVAPCSTSLGGGNTTRFILPPLT
jgi:hypothetical protein